MYKVNNSCRGGGISWIIWVVVILFVLGLIDNNGCDADGLFRGDGGCGCG